MKSYVKDFKSMTKFDTMHNLLDVVTSQVITAVTSSVIAFTQNFM
jgi:hypothetical protein